MVELTGLPVVQVGGVYRHNKGNVFYTGIINQKEWLCVISNASYVITDSFHGTVFSILFNKKFYVSFRTKTNSRLHTLMKSLNINNRNIDDTNFDEDINYFDVNQNLDELRTYSINKLKEVILNNE